MQTNTMLPTNITVERNCHLRRAEWGCTALAEEQSTKKRAGFPTQRPGETGPAVPSVEHAGSGASQLTSFQVCTISIFSAIPSRLEEETWWRMLLGRARTTYAASPYSSTNMVGNAALQHNKMSLS